MKHLFSFFVVATLLLIVGCSKEYDDSALVGRVDDLENRVQRLEQLCQQMNTNISSLQTIVTALQKNDYVTGVMPITENGKTIGYTITFAKAQSITIYHGKDSNHIPIIGVKQDTDGIYYWTLDGEWLLDDAGKKIKAQALDGKDGVDGEDGTDGENGQDGTDGITPQLKIENGYWYVSYDNGASWTQLGKATGEDGKDGTEGKSFFQDITQDENNVYFTLADGTVITVPKGLALGVEFAESDLVVMSPNTTREIAYTVISATDSVKVEVISSADIKAKVVADDANGLAGKIHITTGATIDEYSKVIVFVSNGHKVIMRSITFEEAGLVVEENAIKQASAEGGEVVLEFLSNVDCKVVIPEDAHSWISVVPTTRAMEKQTITLKLEPNEGYYRSATVIVQSPDSILKLEYQVEQEGDLGVEIDPTKIPDNEIWYTTKNNTIISYLGQNIFTAYDDIGLNGAPFDVNIINHYFDGNKCVIECDGPITKINNRCFSVDVPSESIITAIFLPNSVEELGRYCFNMADITEFRVPDNLQICNSPFINNPRLTKFIGNNTDGHSIIIDNILWCYAPGLENDSYVIPDNVIEIGTGAFDGAKIKNITIPEGVKRINYSAFERSSLLSVTIPQSVEYIGHNAFALCFNIQGFYGNSRFVTDDNMCFITDDDIVSGGKRLNAFAGHNMSSYKIPEGITSIRNMSFLYGGENLISLTLPNSIVFVQALAFNGVPKLQYIYGPGTTTDNKGYVKNGVLQLLLGKGITSYYIPEEVTALGDNLFEYNNDIQNIIMHDNVITLGMDCFANCEKLKSITLSAKISTFPFYCFKRSYNIEKIYFRSLEPPKMIDATCPGGFFPEKEYEKLTIYVPNQSKEKYLTAVGWEEFAKYVEGYEYTDLPELDYYTSTDYSQDGEVKTLQTATEGDGIDVVLMGDAYSDRQIADGTYKADMENLYNNLFIEEPYKSFKDHFNVYYVNVVSATEGYEYGNTAIDSYFGDGTLVGGNDNAVFDYALNAISEGDMDEALLIVAMNSDNYAGTCYMYYPAYTTGTYSSGPSVSYFPRGGDATTFAQLLHHEACGHGFAKLADEYAYEYMGAAPSDYVSQIQAQQADLGWWKNVDFTNDQNVIRWSHFINDSRYTNEKVGAYEGGLTYQSGVWRPTENSIMRYNTGGFNAPSREAIYYRIHKLAYGDSWEYDYEEFVEWDARNRTPEAMAARAKSHKPSNYKPTHPPVIVNKSWRKAN